MIKVIIVVWCQHPTDVDASLLTFRTLRTGFPTAAVTVIDNASIIADQVKECCRQNECEYIRRDLDLPHEQLLLEILRHEKAAVIVDPDIVFWENMERLDFSGYLMAGRRIPAHICELTGCHVVERLHTSLLWLPDIQRIGQEFRHRAPQYDTSWRVFAAIIGGRWVRWEPLAGLYHFFRDRAYCFGERELNAYDHMFYGTHLSRVAPCFAPDSIYTEGPRIARENIQAFRGYWRRQDAYFARRHSPFAEQLVADPPRADERPFTQALLAQAKANAMRGDKAPSSATTPQTPEQWLAHLARVAAEGRWLECIASADEALRQWPAQAELLNSRGWALLQLGRHDEALGSFESGLAGAPEHLLLWHNKAWTLFVTGRLAESLPCFDRALAIEPNAANVWRDKSRPLARLGQAAEAGHCLARSEALGRPK